MKYLELNRSGLVEHVICDKCGGEGMVMPSIMWVPSRIDLSQAEQIISKETCKICDGLGAISKVEFAKRRLGFK